MGKIVRAALYLRVSTEEQARYGLSLDAQKEKLLEFAKEQKYVVVGIYADEGKTARKRLSKRQEIHRLLKDVEADKVDMIIFTKLDRWFRNLADYYKVQEILEEHNVCWKAITEQYDTSTANGRLHVNIMLSVAQDEADRTAERIKFVMEGKIARGEPISGKMPIGYKIDGKSIVVDEEKRQMAIDVFDQFVACRSRHQVSRMLSEQYGVLIHDTSIKRMLRNEMYIGVYHGVPGACPALVSTQQFAEVQNILQEYSLQYNPDRRTYLFTGMIHCGYCDHAMTGTTVKSREREYPIYRCNYHFTRHQCANGTAISESKIEQYLIKNLRDIISQTIVEAEAEDAERRSTPPIDKSAVRRKMDRLKDLYINELIDLETYKSDYDRYMDLLATAEQEPPKRDLSPLRDLLDSDFETAYLGLDRKNRRLFWRRLIERIDIDGKDIRQIIFVI